MSLYRILLLFTFLVFIYSLRFSSGLMGVSVGKRKSFEKMSIEARANVIMCVGYMMAIYGNVNKFNILELSMIVLSCVTVFLSSFICHVENESLYRIKENGLLCCLLLPLISLMSNMVGDERFIYSIFYNGIILASLIPLVQRTMDIKHQISQFGLVAIFGFITSVSFWIALLLTQTDFLTSLVILFLLMMQWLLQSMIPICLPGSFTFGELAILSQGCILILLNVIITLAPPAFLPFGYLRSDLPSQDMMIFSKVICILCAFFIAAISLKNWFRVNMARIVFLLVLELFLGWSFLNRKLSKDPLTWFLQVIFKSEKSVFLLVFWILCLSAAVLLAVGYRQNTTAIKGKSNCKRSEKTKIRKVFHLLISLVYLSGIFLDFELLFMASLIATHALIVTESLRFFNVPPIGGPIRQSFSVFLDDQDKGLIVLTPLYLLIGCSSSLWFSFGQDLIKVFPLIGLLTLGIGDSAASYFGSKYGRFHWKDSTKTVEGTLACMVSQVIFVVALQLTGFQVLGSSCIHSWKLITTVILSSLFESFTNQIDNLVLPLFTYLLLC